MTKGLSILGGHWVPLYGTPAVIAVAAVSKLMDSTLGVLWHGVAVMEILLCCGVLIAGRRYPRAALLLLAGVFAAFVAWGLVASMLLNRSCGCFGAQTVNSATVLTFSMASCVCCVSHMAWVDRQWPWSLARAGCNVAVLVSVGLVAESIGRELLHSGPRVAPWAEEAIRQLASTERRILDGGPWRVIVISFDCDQCQRALPWWLGGVGSTERVLFLVIGHQPSAMEMASVLPPTAQVVWNPGVRAPCLPVELAVAGGAVESVRCVSSPLEGR